MSEKRTVFQIELPTGGDVGVIRHRFGDPKSNGIRIAVVAGIRGDTPEGMRIAVSLMRFLQEHEPIMKGIVDVYPCVNPLAAERGSRLWPFFGVL